MRKTSYSVAAAFCVLSAWLMPVPASAQDPVIDVSRLTLPQGVAVAGDPFTYYDDSADATIACFVFSYPGAATTLFFHDLAVNGQTMIADTFIGRQAVDIPSDTPDGQPMCVTAAPGDISAGTSATTLRLTSSAVGTVIAARSDISFPAAFDSVAKRLTALGFDTTDAYFSSTQQSDGSVTYDFYVDISPRADITGSPVTLTVNSASLTTGSGALLPLTGGDRSRTIETDDEIWLGSTTIDPEVGLGKVQVNADISKVLPSTFKSTAKLPPGLTVTATPDQWFVDTDANRTEAGPVTLANSTSKTIHVSVAGSKLSASAAGAAAGTLVDLKLKPSATQYVTVPAKGTADVSPFASTFSGDLRYGYNLSLNATVTVVNPSTFDVKGLKITKGYAVQPLGFDLMTYDAATKTTDVTLVLSQPASASDRTLIFSSGKANGNALKTAVVAGAVNRQVAGGVRQFYIGLGTFKGDVRLGKVLTITGNIVAVTKTKYSNSADVDDESSFVFVQSNTPPELWAYDPLKKATGITVAFENDDDSTAVIGTCKLSITVGGKKISPVKSNLSVKAGGGVATIAVVPGDIRYGGTQVVVSGTYTSGGC